MTENTDRPDSSPDVHYDSLLGEISVLVDTARRSAARSVNSIMTAAYWLVGRRIVESEQAGSARAEYGQAVIEKLSGDLTARFGRGFGVVNLSQMRRFHVLWPLERILQTPSEESPVSPGLRARQEILQMRSEGRGGCAVRARGIAQQGDGLGVPNGAPGRKGIGGGDRANPGAITGAQENRTCVIRCGANWGTQGAREVIWRDGRGAGMGCSEWTR